MEIESELPLKKNKLPPILETPFTYRLNTITNSSKKKSHRRVVTSTNEEAKNNFKLTEQEVHHLYNLYDCAGVQDNVEEFNKKALLRDYPQTDFQTTSYADKNSFNVFYKKMHKNLEYVRKGVTSLSTPSFNFVRSLKKGNILPNPVGLVKRDGDRGKIELNDRRVGDSYVVCLSDALKLSTHVTDINMSKNRLTDLSIVPLIGTIENSMLLSRLSHLNLSYNKLRDRSAEALAHYISDPNCNLEYFNIEGNALGNKNIRGIIDNISRSLGDKIRYVNIAVNDLNDDVAGSIANLVSKGTYLQVLILYQNQFKNFGAATIFSEIKKHERIKIVDISWNLIGTNLSEEMPTADELKKASKNENNKFNNAYLNELKTTMEYKKKSYLDKVVTKQNTGSLFAKELCDLFHNKKTQMIHLDISYNNINVNDAAVISEHIKDNHTILGIHVDGNDMMVDELGFVYPVEKGQYSENHFANSQIFYRISETHQLIKSNVINIQKIRGKNNCWICEGWNEILFSYRPTKQFDVSTGTVKLYLNFEGYKPYDTNPKQDSFVCHRMCPPGRLIFYLMMNGIPVENYGSKTYELKDAIVHTEMPEETEDSDEEKEPKQFIITRVAKSDVLINSEVINPFDYSSNLKHCIPRPEKIIHKKKRPRTPWTFPISIWAWYKYQYEGESKSTIDDAFEFDFNRGQYAKDKDLNDEQLAVLKEFLRKRYPKIVESYKNLSSYLGWKIWQIGQNQITDFASSCPGLLDNKYVVNDVLVKVTEVKSNMLDKEERKKNQNVPDNIIRHQWMMLFVKIAKDKYFRTKQIADLTECVKVSFEKHFDPFINQFDNHKWRIDRYYNEYVDNVIKAYIPVLNAVFLSNAKPKVIGRESNWMWLDEFTGICNSLMDTDFPVKEIPTIFSLSFRLNTNEIDRDNHWNMRFPEFLEAFSRFADRLSPVPNGENKLDWNMQMRQDQHLSAKIETLMPSMLKLIKRSDLLGVRKFPFPERDEESGLLIIDYDNPFYNGLLPPRRTKGKRPTAKKGTFIKKPTVKNI